MKIEITNYIRVLVNRGFFFLLIISFTSPVYPLQIPGSKYKWPDGSYYTIKSSGCVVNFSFHNNSPHTIELKSTRTYFVSEKTGEVLDEELLMWNSKVVPSGGFTKAREQKPYFGDIFDAAKAGAGFACRNVKLLEPKIRYKYIED